MSPTCIYPGPHTETFAPEHYLPIALGRFEGMDLLQDRVCTQCNNEIGKRVETQFLRAGPTGFFRWVVGIRGRDGLPPSPFYRGSAGTEPIYIVGKAPPWPFELLWEVEPGTENVCPLRQIVFHHPLRGYKPIALTDRFLSQVEALKTHLAHEGLQTAKAVHVFAAKNETGVVEGLLTELGFEPPKEWSSTATQEQRIELVVTVTVTEAYFRAVAKIAFHYLLKICPELTGLEHEFSAIKDFIWNGGNASQFVIQRKDQFIANFKLGYRPTNWMHLLSVERSGGFIHAFVQFFVGPHSLPLPYTVKIGRDPARIHTIRRRYAHEYVILEAGTDNIPRGVMQDAQPMTHILIPRR